MHSEIARIARRLAEDSNVSDAEIIELIQKLRGSLPVTGMIKLEQYRYLKVLEVCAMLRSLQPAGRQAWHGGSRSTDIRR